MRARAFGLFLAALIGFLFTVSSSASHQDVPEYGPARGTLVIIGGAMTEASGLAQRFIQAAGGPDKKFVIVPTNGGNRNRNGELIQYADGHHVSWPTTS